jgi:hypothetical protein
MNNINKDILDSELKTFKLCECCFTNESKVVFIMESGVCVILSHLCDKCFDDNVAITELKYCFFNKV